MGKRAMSILKGIDASGEAVTTAEPDAASLQLPESATAMSASCRAICPSWRRISLEVRFDPLALPIESGRDHVLLGFQRAEPALTVHRPAPMLVEPVGKDRAMFVYALFWDEESAATATQNLLDAHFAAEDISVLLQHEVSVEESGLEHKTGIPRGAAIGGVLGAVGGALTIPFSGWLAVGPILAVLKGAFFGGATGTLAGVMGGLGFWHEDIGHENEEEIQKGAVLVGVTTRERADIVEEALQKAGALNVHRGSKAEAAEDVRLRGRLVEDHRTIDDNLAQVANAANAGDFDLMDQALRRVEVHLRGHLDGEEKYLFGRFEKEHPVEIAELRAEHAQFLETLEKLEIDAELHALRRGRIDDFIAALRAHSQREDAKLYQWAEALPEPSKRLMSSFLLGLRARLQGVEK